MPVFKKLITGGISPIMSSEILFCFFVYPINREVLVDQAQACIEGGENFFEPQPFRGARIPGTSNPALFLKRFQLQTQGGDLSQQLVSGHIFITVHRVSMKAHIA
jgi:hypothetical protein